MNSDFFVIPEDILKSSVMQSYTNFWLPNSQRNLIIIIVKNKKFTLK